MKDFRDIDAAILKAIESGKTRYLEIWIAVEEKAKPFITKNGGADRVVDRRLQALRKGGWITCEGQRWKARS